MRLHRLTLTAFGPFAGTETVDFDDLTADGVFLLHGPTGAGKTSVLDAVCFALYGRIPGARSAGVRLRSDHAAPDVAPSVCLEFSVGPRRVRITRSPAWERPKRRGTGTTTAQASVLVEEAIGGEWLARATRLDDAGMIVDDLVGLGPEQFTTLVMLPQGEFATFLRADAEARRKVLERLFRTDSFTRVQGLLRERRAAARRDAEAVTGRLREMLAQANQASRSGGFTWSEAAATHQPSTSTGGFGLSPTASPSPSTSGSGPAVDALELPCDDAEELHPQDLLHGVVDRVASVRASAVLGFEQALAARESAAARAAAAEARCRHARREHESLTRITTLMAEQRELSVLHPRRVEWQHDLDAATRALTVAAHLDATVRARRLADAAHERVRDSASAALAQGLPPALVEGSGEDALTEDLDRRRRCRDALAAGVPVWAELDRRLAHHRRAQHVHACLAADLHDAEDRCRATEQARRSLSARREEDAGAETLVAECRAHEAQALAVDEAAHEADVLDRRIADGLRRRTVIVNEATSARQRWLDLRERRLDGMAAELATGLRAGSPCPVCGSEAHPSPARPSDARVTPDDEEAARAASELLAADMATIDAELAALRARAEAARARAGGLDVAEADRRLTAARHRLAAATDAHARLVAIERETVAMEKQQATATEAVELARRRIADAADAQGRAAALVDAGRGELTRVLAPLQDDPDLAPLLPPTSFSLADATPGPADDVDPVAERGDHPLRLQRVLDRLSAQCEASAGLVDARSEARARERARVEAEASLAQALATARFSSESDAVAAGRSTSECEDLRRRCREYDDRVAAVRAQVAQLGLDSCDDLDGSSDAADAHRERLARAGAALQEATRIAEATKVAEDAALGTLVRAETAVAELQRLGRLVTTASRTALPVLQRLADLDALARCAEGTGGGNTLRMSLSAFILAARLEQVAQAASVRLHAMSGGRYTLVHSDGAGTTGRGRAGLALRVVDAWTGRDRETTSLSGGEAFYASLALALGLADVVGAEAGGAAFDTLFIDEGFGSLDPDTLDEVLDTVDQLRSGGRIVGIVSHLPDLRDRIPARLEVVKGRHGSQLRTAQTPLSA